MASRNVSTDRRAAAALLKETREERETIGIAIDLADCVVGMSPARLPPSPLNWGSEALMVVDPSGSNHHLAGRRERQKGISSHQSWPSKQAN